ncbi:glutathione S-transferase [Cognatiyoonia koreensis]|uniref:Glutathione S-transferase n=1 Tax=Cognatiyoonia koreensis TaxID=364200 RepID=A0A1I0NKE7_9RHOB|nr:glutathione S-transferase family protein [Cognatiyoonia koreensis]SEW01664.1 glutathione S-transferase [Cognatiyoonia koreensis]
MIRLHHVPQTRSMRSLWLLYELGVDFDLKTYGFDAAIKSPAYLALNGAGRVPSLELDDAVLFESGAIAEALCERFPKAGLGRAPGDPERYDWLNWIHFAETISQHVAALTQQHIMLFEDHMRSPIIMKLEAKRLAKTFGVVDQALAGRDHLLSAFSAADIGVAQAVYMGLHYTKSDGFANLQAWYDRVTARPAFQKSLPNNDGIYARDFYPPWDPAGEHG